MSGLLSKIPATYVSFHSTQQKKRTSVSALGLHRPCSVDACKGIEQQEIAELLSSLNLHTRQARLHNRRLAMWRGVQPRGEQLRLPLSHPAAAAVACSRSAAVGLAKRCEALQVGSGHAKDRDGRLGKVRTLCGAMDITGLCVSVVERLSKDFPTRDSHQGLCGCLHSNVKRGCAQQCDFLQDMAFSAHTVCLMSRGAHLRPFWPR